jgi:hypothetical protein
MPSCSFPAYVTEFIAIVADFSFVRIKGVSNVHKYTVFVSSIVNVLEGGVATPTEETRQGKIQSTRDSD